MAVGADVLDGGGTDEAGDFGEGFDAGEAFADSVFDDMIPIFATHDAKAKAVVDRLFGDAAHAVDDDDAIVAFVVTDGVGTVAEDKSR